MAKSVDQEFEFAVVTSKPKLFLREKRRRLHTEERLVHPGESGRRTVTRWKRLSFGFRFSQYLALLFGARRPRRFKADEEERLREAPKQLAAAEGRYSDAGCSTERHGFNQIEADET